MAAPKTGPTAKKRSDERHGHRTEAEQSKAIPVTTSDQLADPPEANPEWHYSVRQIWDALLISPLRSRSEATDWAQAYFTMDALTNVVESGYAAGKMMNAVSLMNALLLTESARLAANVQITRTVAEVDHSKLSSLEAARVRREKRALDNQG